MVGYRFCVLEGKLTKVDAEAIIAGVCFADVFMNLFHSPIRVARMGVLLVYGVVGRAKQNII
jgi:hypothetical protein